MASLCNPSIFFLFFLSVCINHAETKVPPQNVLTQNETLTLNDTFHVHRIADQPMKKMAITYTITFHLSKCCPVLYFFAQTPNPPYNSTHVNHRCFIGGADFHNVATYSQYFIYMKQSFPYSGCQLVGEKYVCSGRRHFGFVQLRTWYYAIGYECDSLQALTGIHLDMVYQLNEPLPCDELRHEKCRRLFNYSKTVFPNRLGHTTQEEATTVLRPLELFDCYQHVMAFICRSLFQECREGEIYVPCQQMCKDFAVGCHETLLKWKQSVRCGNFPPSLDPIECMYEPVFCEPPEAPEFGHIVEFGTELHNLTEYSCNHGYVLEEGHAQRFCMHSGKWNGTQPTCVPVVNAYVFPKHAVITAAILLFLTGLAVGLCIRFRHDLALVLLYNYLIASRYRHKGEDTNRKRKLFLTYSNLDRDDVEDFFLPQMERHLPNCDVITFERDFQAGRPLVDCIHEGVWTTDAVVVLLTQNYVDSSWCEYEFTEAQSRSAEEPGFRLIIVLNLKDGATVDDLQNMPENLRTYVCTRIYLSVKERLFWNKLRKCVLS